MYMYIVYVCVLVGVRIRTEQKTQAMQVFHASRSSVTHHVATESALVQMCVSVRTDGVEMTVEHHCVPSKLTQLS